MTELLVAELASRFWELAGTQEPFPRSLRPAVSYALPVALVELPRFGVATLRRFLAGRDTVYPPAGGDRPLRAALLARAGSGFIFLDATDPDDERRFSLAHEVAHFMADYWWPRRLAEQRVGRASLEVLDGRRPPTPIERVDAALGNVELLAHVHLMERTPDGHPAGAAIDAAEQTADALALELLAPARLAVPLLRQSRGDPAQMLTTPFGLPPLVARAFAARLAPPRPSATAELRRLGLGSLIDSHPSGRPASHFVEPRRNSE